MRQKKIKTKSKKSLAIARLDTVFSKYIRRRDCGYGFGRCISCNAIIEYGSCDCGHYENRKHMSVRYDEHNCNAQCVPCNRFDEGNKSGYRRNLILKIGEKAVEMVEIKKFNTCNLSEFEIGILISEYKLKLAVLEQKDKKIVEK